MAAKQRKSQADSTEEATQAARPSLIDSLRQLTVGRAANSDRIDISSHTRVKVGSTDEARPPPLPRAAGPTAGTSYRLVGEISSGETATVHLAVQRHTRGFERVVAIKRIHPHLSEDRRFREMLREEASVAARVEHPSVTSILDFVEGQDGTFLVLEHLPGEPLWSILQALRQRVDLTMAVRYPLLVARVVSGFAEGLQAAHKLVDGRSEGGKVLHSGVNLETLFVLFDGTVRVTDLGLSQARERAGLLESTIERSQLGYLSPEQLQQLPLDPRSDIWSLGVVLWEALTLRRLFSDDLSRETLLARTSEPIVAPSAINPVVPPALDGIVAKTLQRNVEARYSSAGELARDLQRYVAGFGEGSSDADIVYFMNELFPGGAERHAQDARRALGISEQTGAAARLAMSAAPSLSSLWPNKEEPASEVADWSDASTHALVAFPSAVVTPPATRVEKSGPLRRIALLASVGLLLASFLGAWLLLRPLLGPSAPAARGATVREATPVPPSPAAAATPAARALAEPRAPARAESTPASAPSAGAPTLVAQPATQVEPPKARPSQPPRAPAPEINAPVEAVGTVAVGVSSGSADVFENGVLLGRTPTRLRLIAGRHVLTLRPTAGGKNTAINVEVRPGATSFVTVRIGDKP